MNFADEKAMVSFVIGKKDLPEWQTKLFKKNREAVQVHSKGELFFKLDRLFPNEHPDSKENRVLAFEPITKGSFQKGISQILRIFNNSSYTAEASQKTIDYITKHQFSDKNLFSYYLDEWVKWALGTDPNAISVVYPEAFVKDKSFEQIIFVKSEHITYRDIETVVFKSEEESEVEYSIETTRAFSEIFYDPSIGRHNERYCRENTYNDKLKVSFKRTVWHLFDKGMFHRIEEPMSGGEYDVQSYPLKNTKYPPIIEAGGVMNDKVYESHLQPFVAFGNLALLQHSQHTAVNFMYSFPRMSEIEVDCDNQDCMDGMVACDITTEYPEGEKKCERCKGTGAIVSQSPYKVYRRRLNGSDLSPDGGAQPDYDDVKYYTPDVSILQYSKEEWKNYLSMAEQAVFISQRVTTGNVESAESKQVDAENMHSFLFGPATTFYGNLRFLIQQLENMMNSSPIEVSVARPYGFAILTESEAFAALDILLKSPAPEVVKGPQIDTFISKFVSQSSPVKKAYNVLKMVDRLLLKTDDQVLTWKTNNIFTPEQCSIHQFAYSELEAMHSEDRELYNQDEKKIAETLKKRLKQYAPLGSDLKQQMLDEFGGGGGNTLAQSVGGLTGMIEIAKAVASGLYDLEAAVALVSSRFGVSEEEARKQLGTPSISNSQQEIEKVATLTT